MPVNPKDTTYQDYESNYFKSWADYIINNLNSEIKEEIEENYKGIIFYDGFDDAIVGLGTRFGIMEEVVVYDKNKILNIILITYCQIK